MTRCRKKFRQLIRSWNDPIGETEDLLMQTNTDRKQTLFGYRLWGWEESVSKLNSRNLEGDIFADVWSWKRNDQIAAITICF